MCSIPICPGGQAVLSYISVLVHIELSISIKSVLFTQRTDTKAKPTDVSGVWHLVNTVPFLCQRDCPYPKTSHVSQHDCSMLNTAIKHILRTWLFFFFKSSLYSLGLFLFISLSLTIPLWSRSVKSEVHVHNNKVTGQSCPLSLSAPPTSVTADCKTHSDSNKSCAAGIVQTKITILISFTHPHVIPNQFIFCRICQLFLLHTMKVNWELYCQAFIRYALYITCLYILNSLIKMAFYCGQPKAHLCNNHTVWSASWYATPVRWMDYLCKGEILTNTDLDRFVNNIWEK